MTSLWNKLNRRLSLKINVFLSFADQILLILAPFVTAPYISRTLLPSGTGSYSYANSIAQFFILFAVLGFAEYGSVSIAKTRDDPEKTNKKVWSIFFSKIFLCFAAAVLYSVFVSFSFFDSSAYPLLDKKVFLLFTLWIIAAGFEPSFFYYGTEKFSFLFLLDILIRLIEIASIFLLIKGPSDLSIYALIMCLSTLVFSLLSFFSMCFMVGRPAFVPQNFFHEVACAIAHFLPSNSQTLYIIIIKYLLGTLVKDSSSSGYFEQADKLITLGITITCSSNSIVMPHMAYLYATQPKAVVEEKIQQCFSLYFFVSLPVFFGIVLVNPCFTPAFFGVEYLPSVKLIYYLSPRLLLVPFFGLLNALYFIPKEKLFQRNLVYSFGLLFISLGGYVLIKFYKAEGAALACSLTDLVVCYLFSLIFFKRKKRFLDFLSLSSVPLSSAMLMTSALLCVSYLLQSRIGYLFLSVILIMLGALVYFISLLLLKDDFVLWGLDVIKKKAPSLRKKRSA